jgi:antitoxin (DNA-binding transcriptional repressor) of toxin-antitoxin stability system
MQTVSVGELQHNLSLYLNQAKTGDEIMVEDNNEIIARILRFNTQTEEQLLVSQGFMTMPKKTLSEDYWKTDAPEISIEKIVETIRNERDED